MNERTNYIIYLVGTIVTGMGITYLITNLVIFGADLSLDEGLSSVVFTLVGLLILAVGLYSFRRIVKEATIFSLLFISCVMTGAFTCIMLFESGIWAELLCLAIVSAIFAIALYLASKKTGAYDVMNAINPFNKKRI